MASVKQGAWYVNIAKITIRSIYGLKSTASCKVIITKEVYETVQSKIFESYYWSLWMAATYANKVVRMLTSSNINNCELLCV